MSESADPKAKCDPPSGDPKGKSDAPPPGDSKGKDAPPPPPPEPTLDEICNDPNFGGGDPQAKFRELCKRTKECAELKNKLTECNDRVNSRTKTEEKCVEEVIDFFHCVDHCAAKRFFKLLK